MKNFLIYFIILFNQDLIVSLIYSDCTHLILPSRCQCYHSGGESQLHCRNIQLKSLPKLPNSMRWYALDFSWNHITTIDSYVFSDIYVEKLLLTSNLLQSIDQTAFEYIQNLKELFLDHNQLKEFNPNRLTSLGISLKIFHLSYNPIGYLDLGGIFLQLPLLKEFYAISCQLNHTSLSTLLKLTDSNHHYIELIDLSSNHLTYLCNNYFQSFFNLIELRLNHNQIYSIENYFIRSLNYIKILNLAFNSLATLPNLFSSSLEYLNLSSNNIQSLNDYFVANLPSIRQIDFDSNKQLSTISSRAFCSINISSIEKLSFRYNNILSIEIFSDLLCRFEEKNQTNYLIDLNHNVHLECNCMLRKYESYLFNYYDLTCKQHGQDIYFISKLTNIFANCPNDFCPKQNLCDENYMEEFQFEGKCPIETENSTTEFIPTTITLLDFYENSTDINLKSMGISIDSFDLFLLFLFHLLIYYF